MGWLGGHWTREEYALETLRQLWELIQNSDVQEEIGAHIEALEQDAYTKASKVFAAVEVALDDQQWQ